VLVVVTHVSSVYFYAPSANWNAANFYGSLSRGCVPMFVMLTGALFLKRQESLRYFYGKRMMRLALPLVFWSVAWLAWLSQSGSAPSNWVLAVIKGPVVFHLWYFYILLCLSLLMPVFVKFYTNSAPKEIWGVIGLWFLLCSVLPAADPARHIYGIDQSGAITVVNYGGLLLLGAALTDVRLSRSKAIAIGLALFSIGTASTIALTVWEAARAGHPSEFFYNYTSPTVVLASAGAFLASMHVGRAPRGFHGVMMVIAECSLGVYCLHLLALDRIRAYFGVIGGPQNAWAAIPLSVAAILLVTVPVIYCMRLIKPLRSVA
jgi:surface polysaccharide O-acyltransferase-like enzyme